MQTNLVSNAVKFKPPQSEVIISARIAQNAFRIEIQDYNFGIKENDLQRL